MKLAKKILVSVAILLFLFLVAAIAIPFLYKDKIIGLVKEEANKTLNAKMDFKDVDISLLRSFPALNVQLEKVTVDGINAFEGVRLFEGEEIEVEVNLLDAYNAKDNFPLKSLILNQPKVNVLVLKDGKANWDIMKPSEAEVETESSNFLVKLKRYIIENGTLSYKDESLDFQMEAKDLNHSSSGDFSANEFDLNTLTHITDLTATYEGINYLNHVKADLDAIIQMDVPNLKFTLKDNHLNMNNLLVNAEGSVDMNDNDYVLDLKFQSPQGDFKSLWSMIPGVYTADYAKATILGKMGFSGFVKGTYNGDIPLYPAFQIKVDVQEGNVKYPDLPVGIAGIFTNILINSPSSDFNKIVVDIPQFKMQVGNNPIDGRFHLTTPITDPTINGALKGTMDLAEIGRAVPIEGVSELRGIVKSDISINASQSKIDKQQYDQVDLSGELTINDMFVQQAGTPAIAINHLNTDFSPQRVRVQSLNAKFGKSDLQATGQIDNILAYFSPEKTMEGQFSFTSNYVDANEWISETDTTTTTAVSSEAVEKPFDHFNIKMDGFINKMDYDVYQLTEMKAKGMLSPNESLIETFSTKIGDSDIQANGKINNMMNYLFDNEVMTGEMTIKSKYLDLNQFMVEETTNEAIEVIPVPANIDLMLHSDLQKVKYTNFDISDIKGDVVVKNEVAEMKDVKGSILGGNIAFAGAYDTRDLSKPKFNLQYELEQLDFNKAFNTFNTFRAIVPIGKFIDGKLTTNLKMNGILGKDLIPDLSSLNLSGFLYTFGASIRNSDLFKKLSQKLQIKALENINLQDSKNWIEVKDGYVELEETSHKIGNDITLKVKGRHNLLKEDMFYSIQASIPKEQLNKTTVGAAANQGWNLLAAEAAKRGVNLENGEFVNLNINLTGSMLNPAFKIVPVGTNGNVTLQDKANEVVKEATGKVVDSVKTVVNDKVKAAKDSVNAVVKEEKDKLVKQGKEEIVKIIDTQKAPKLDSLLNEDATKVNEKVKDVIKDLNPFKKKKNGN